MSLYSNIQDVKREFKGLLSEGNVMTDDRILEFLLQANSVINSYIGTIYSVPVTGAASVNQIDTISIDTITDSIDYSFKVSGGGVTREYKINSGVGATASTIATALQDAVNNDFNSIVTAIASASSIQLESKVIGLAYTVLDLTAEISLVNDQAAVLGSQSLRLLRKIESNLAACKVASILQTKVAKKLATSGVNQDIKDGSCAAKALAMLKDIQDGKASLGDAELADGTGGLTSHNSTENYEGYFKVQTRQW